MKTIVVGLGNPILGDDSVGWRIASELQKNEVIPSGITIECMAVGGISLMESLIGYDRAIIIDAITTHQSPRGTIKYFTLDEVPNPFLGHMSSAHDTSLQEALKMGRSIGAHLPDDITVFTVETDKVYEFSETLSPSVAEAVTEAVAIISRLLLESSSTETPT